MMLLIMKTFNHNLAYMQQNIQKYNPQHQTIGDEQFLHAIPKPMKPFYALNHSVPIYKIGNIANVKHMYSNQWCKSNYHSCYLSVPTYNNLAPNADSVIV